MPLTIPTICCGKAMVALGSIKTQHNNVQSLKRWLCLECGRGLDLVDYRITEEELQNERNLWVDRFEDNSIGRADSSEDYFPITSLHKDDLRSIYRDNTTGKVPESMERKISQLTEADMQQLAAKMADAFCNCCYWDALKAIFEDYCPTEEIPDKPSPANAPENELFTGISCIFSDENKEAQS